MPCTPKNVTCVEEHRNTPKMQKYYPFTNIKESIEKWRSRDKGSIKVYRWEKAQD